MEDLAAVILSSRNGERSRAEHIVMGFAERLRTPQNRAEARRHAADKNYRLKQAD